MNQFATHQELDQVKDKINKHDLDIALINQALTTVFKSITELHDTIKDQNNETKKEVNVKFGPVKLVVYGGIALVLNSVLLALINNLISQ